MTDTQGPRPVPNLDPGRFGLPRRPVRDAALVRDAVIVAHDQGAHVLAPTTELQWVPPGFVLLFRVLYFSPGGEWEYGSNGDWYEKEGRLALHKTPLRQLAQARAMSWITERIDDRRRDYLWEYRALGRMRGLDGEPRTVTGHREYDLRDSSPEVEDMHAKAQRKNRTADERIRQARGAGARKCESMAVSAMIRDALGIRQGYTRKEAERAFVVVSIAPDPLDPVVAAAARAQAAEAVGQVYGPPMTRPALEDGGEPSDPLQELHDQRQRQPEPVPTQRPQEQPRRREDPTPPPQRDPTTRPRCRECGTALSDRIADYSQRMFGAKLCMSHQPKGGR